MAAVSQKIVIPLASLLAITSAAAATYAFGLPPFERRGDISASDVCASLGSSPTVVPALKGSLPTEPDYRFDDRRSGGDITSQSSDYTADCLVWGEESLLLSARTEMMLTATGTSTQADPSEVRSWSTAAVDVPESRLTSFDAGTKGVTAARKAAVLVPCASPGHIPGGTYSLSVVVDVRGHGEDSDESGSRQDLIDLVVSAARFSHAKAKCDLPSELPGGEDMRRPASG
ncbi:hypothetical protein [Streptomyces wuyuanensis]|uniref:PknH-like extracellular domain-containing protein n=1 Tax=Streptomyces wuyuanensis TaxID=1196353 RepID=A0A1G9XPH1_9ACTN|nr:hypothetical protein [Streptomyces wuyuanensis]SDM98664.1 hypothetical protein SAMN05444921_116139 [Streptomyces wuyuanensis]